MYISIEKYIEMVKTTELPKNYYGTRYHRNFISSLSLDDYTKWLNYLHEKEKQYNRRYYQEHKEQIRERERRYFKDEVNRETKRASHREWKRNNLERYKVYYQRYKEHIKAKWKEYYANNRDKVLERAKDYYQANWLVCKQRRFAWLEKNKDNEEYKKKNIERVKRWVSKNKEKRRKYMRKYMKKYYLENKNRRNNVWK